MAQSPYIASTVLMGLLLAAVLVVAARSFEGRGYSMEGSESRSSRIATLAGDPTVWMVGFVLLVLVFGGGAVLFVSGWLDAAAAAAVGLALAVSAAVVLGAYLLVGTYRSARSWGRSSAGAAGTAVVMLGLVVVAAIVVKLTLG